jgi:5'-nucleotidase
MDSNRRILVTNDDGVDSPGIRWLAHAATLRGYEVVVAAPVTEFSGASASLSAEVGDDGLAVQDRSGTALPGVPVYGSRASLAYAVLSGINLGCNAGHAILHSGTVAAALTAAQNGRRAMTVSLNAPPPVQAAEGRAGDGLGHDDLCWESAAGHAGMLLQVLFDTPDGTVLNVNVPNTPCPGSGDCGGVRWRSSARPRWSWTRWVTGPSASRRRRTTTC